MKALITEPRDFGESNLELLKERAEVATGPFSRKELLRAVKDIEVLIVRLKHVVDKDLLEEASQLKYILTPTTGLNHIDEEETARRGIRVISLRGEREFLESIPSTAEHTWALMLSLLRKIPAAHNDVMEGNWERDAFKAYNLHSYKLGILGFGRVGSQISRFAKVFNMPYLFYDIDPALMKHSCAVETLEEFLAEIDILSIHIPLNQQNFRFLNESNLKFLKPSSYLINTSRGEVLDEKYLAKMMYEKKISGIATDVLEREMCAESRKENHLIKAAKKLQNIIITPHIGGATYDSMWSTEEFVIRKFVKELDQHKIGNI